MTRMYQVTSKNQLFAGQEANHDVLGHDYYRATYDTLEEAQYAAKLNADATIWSYIPGLKSGGRFERKGEY